MLKPPNVTVLSRLAVSFRHLRRHIQRGQRFALRRDMLSCGAGVTPIRRIAPACIAMELRILGRALDRAGPGFRGRNAIPSHGEPGARPRSSRVVYRQPASCPIDMESLRDATFREPPCQKAVLVGSLVCRKPLMEQRIGNGRPRLY